MKIWKLEAYIGKRENRKQYRIASKDESVKKDFENRMEMAIRQNGQLGNLEVQVISGRKDAALSRLLNRNQDNFLVNEKAKEVLEPILAEWVEFIPVKSSEGTLYLMNVLCVANDLNLENSEAEYLIIRKLAFVQEKVPTAPIFRMYVDNYKYRFDIFVTQELKKVVETNGLTGFDFVDVGGFSVARSDLEEAFITLGVPRESVQGYIEKELQDREVAWLATYHFAYSLNENLRYYAEEFAEDIKWQKHRNPQVSALLEAGAEPKLIADFAYRLYLDAYHDILSQLDNLNATDLKGLPTWKLMEQSSEGELTGRVLKGLDQLLYKKEEF